MPENQAEFLANIKEKEIFKYANIEDFYKIGAFMG
jgi:hypothetical protein